ncbi:hypothetical protein [Streptomyces sp. LaBMicrA B280]|uniref:PGAP1-like alpha/beta domain-containing protein n=1 Tax=Streptomyces sp. LaBMicrA B280 TaxID=3391001 RepID=UPI003BA3EF29
MGSELREAGTGRKLWGVGKLLTYTARAHTERLRQLAVTEDERAGRRHLDADPGAGPARLVFVAHSMGGLLTREALHLDGTLRGDIRAVMTVGTPCRVTGPMRWTATCVRAAPASPPGAPPPPPTPSPPPHPAPLYPSSVRRSAGGGWGCDGGNRAGGRSGEGGQGGERWTGARSPNGWQHWRGICWHRRR